MDLRKKLRIFIGIKISQGLKDKIVQWQKLHSGLSVRFISSDNLHITLIPPWYIHPDELEKVTQKLETAGKGISTFNIKFTSVQFGPYMRHPRLIWLHGESEKTILQLKKDLINTLKSKTEKREFITHLTIARFKPMDFNSFPKKKPEENFLWTETVDNFTLFESKLSLKGAEYKILKEYRFYKSFQDFVLK